MKVQSVVLCAGKSTRFKSETNKLLHQVSGRPLFYWSIKNALSVSNFPPILVISPKHEEDIKKAVTELFFNSDFVFVRQEHANGTGGAVKSAMPFLPQDAEQIIVTFGDAPLIKLSSLNKLINIKTQKNLMGLITSQIKNPTGYGRIIRDSNTNIIKITEELDANLEEKNIKEINTGVAIYDKLFLQNNIEKLTNNNAKKEYYLTDLIALAQTGVGSIEIDEDETHGVNTKEQMAIAQEKLNYRIIEQWLKEGVSFIDPKNTYVEEGVIIAQDSLIYPQVYLGGQTTIAQSVIIENGSIIRNCHIEKGARISPYSHIEGAVIKEGATVGPFARIRPGTVIESKAKIGNFVEIKNTYLGKNSKASHLAYLGDAVIGENVNIGAGSITCNYDGKVKHQTFIGEKAFIGSNSTLIAPLEIGKGSYIAAGSIISKNVPAKALAFGRAKQINRERKIS